MDILPRPFADYFNVSIPAEDFEQCRDAVLGIAYETGGHVAYEGLCRHGDKGTIKYGHQHKVGWISFSGDSLGQLRKHGRFLDTLATIGGFQHRVTTLHATLDLAVDAPPVLEELYRRAITSGVQLTRKSIPARQVQRVWGPGLPDNRETGTIYLGKRGAGVWAKVYDKRSQHLMVTLQQVSPDSQPGFVEFFDTGPLTRYEISLGRNVGATLRDVAEPLSIFWHHAGDLLPQPPGVPPWEPQAEGYTLPPAREPDYAQQMSLLLEHSADVRKAVTLAGKLGPHGGTILLGRIQRMLDAATGALLQTAGTA